MKDLAAQPAHDVNHSGGEPAEFVFRIAAAAAAAAASFSNKPACRILFKDVISSAR
jgi:hypothetical protein